MELGKDYMENFAIMMPTTAIYEFKGCQLFGATGKEFEEFSEWFEKQNYHQLSLGVFKIDMWIRYNDLVIDSIGYSIQDLFKRWKENPPSKDGYEVTTIKLK